MSNGSTGSAAVRQEGPGGWESPSLDGEAAADVPGELDGVYRAHASRLVRSLARRAGSREDALDIVQEAFSKFLGMGPARSARVERPEAFLHRMARNLLNDRIKMERRRSAHLHVVADNEPLAGVDQQHLLETRDMLRRLEAAMLKLKPKTREIFMAHRLDGMSYAEIAERTGLSVKGVEKQMSKAIAQIDRMLDRS